MTGEALPDQSATRIAPCFWCADRSPESCPACGPADLERTRRALESATANWTRWEDRGRAAEKRVDQLERQWRSLRELLGIRS